MNFYICNPKKQGELAQLARALAWHARGRRFDSDILHLNKKGVNFSLLFYLYFLYIIIIKVIKLITEFIWLFNICFSKKLFFKKVEITVCYFRSKLAKRHYTPIN